MIGVTWPIREEQNNASVRRYTELKWSHSLLSYVVLLACLFSSALLGADYYTAISNGNDTNPGTSSLPFKTIKKGVSILRPGDTLFIRGGTYAEYISSNDFKLPSGTSWTSAVTISGYPGETVIMRPNSTGNVWNIKNSTAYMIIQDMIIDAVNVSDNGFYIANGSNHIRLLRLEIKNAQDHGVHFSFGNPAISPDYNEILKCRIHDNGSIADLDHGVYMSSSHNLVDGCEFYNNAAYGIQVYSGSYAVGNNTIRNSKFHSNARLGGAGGGITLWSGAKDMASIAYNNIVWDDHWGISTAGWPHEVYHNTVYDCAIGIWIHSGPGIIKNNIAYLNGQNLKDSGGSGVFAGNLTMNPSFIDPLAFDLRLKSGSPAIDAVGSLADVTHDHFGTPRPRGMHFDIGAHEYQSTNTLTAPTDLRVVSIVP